MLALLHSTVCWVGVQSDHQHCPQPQVWPSLTQPLGLIANTAWLVSFDFFLSW